MTQQQTRKPVAEMTTDEKLSELVEHARAFADILTALGSNPMVRSMMQAQGMRLP